MAVAVAVAVSEGEAVTVAGLTKRFLNQIQEDLLINVWGYCIRCRWPCPRKVALCHSDILILSI